MSDLDGLIDLIPIGDIAKKLGIDESVAKSAVKAAVPVIVGGLAANAKTDSGAKALEGALAKHAGKSPKGIAKAPDTADGQKIVNHVFGAKTKDVTAAVADKAGGNATQEVIAQILPIIAPIVLAWLSSQFLGGKADTPAPAAPAASSGGGIGELLGGLMGSKAGQDMIGGVIGGLLGGGK